jgi:hypothetical protein
MNSARDPAAQPTPRAQPLWPLAGANGGETCMSSRPRSPPPRVQWRSDAVLGAPARLQVAARYKDGRERGGASHGRKSLKVSGARKRGGGGARAGGAWPNWPVLPTSSTRPGQPSSRAAEQPSSRASRAAPTAAFCMLQPISPGRSASSRTNEGMQAAGAGPPCCISPGHKGPANRV